MTIAVTAAQQSFTRPSFSPQFFQTQTGGGFQRLGYTIQHQPYLMNTCMPALSPSTWSSAGQAGTTTSSGAAKYHG